MVRNIQRLSQGQYDLLVIGGGINGAAIANMAAANGLKVALIEKDDFASGTSSKSTKLMHGGLRYLENFEFDLVSEALKERTLHLRSYPYLVKPLKFIIPVYKNDIRPLWMMKLGVWLYDFLSGNHTIEKHKTLSGEEALQKIPELNVENLSGAVMYADAQMDDGRIVLENVLSADEKGAHVANYVEARSLIKENGKAVGVIACDSLTKDILEIRAKKIICAVGPWTNLFMDKESNRTNLKVRATKGIHIVYRKKFSDEAILITTRKDRRIFFVIPWMGHSLIGTTDTDFSGKPDDVSASNEDIEYLFHEVARVFPKHQFIKENIISTFAGLRPLVNKPGSPSKLSRKHVIDESYSGIIYVIGGKYTTYRKIAEDALKMITKKALISTKEYYPLYGSGEIKEDFGEIAKRYQLEKQTVEALYHLYGCKLYDVLALTKNNPSFKEPILANLPFIKAQIAYAFKTEMASSVDDIIFRRLSLHYQDCDLPSARRVIEDLTKSTA